MHIVHEVSRARDLLFPYHKLIAGPLVFCCLIYLYIDTTKKEKVKNKIVEAPYIELTIFILYPSLNRTKIQGTS